MSDPINRKPIHHVCYLVDDIPNAVDHWVEAVGAGPFFWLGQHIEFDEAQFRGEPCVLDHSAVIGSWGDIFVELGQIHDISPAPFEHAFVGASADINRVAHASYMVENAEAENKRLRELGAQEFFRARKGPVKITFYEWPLFGHPIEVHQKSDALEATFRMVAAAAEGWDGSDPIRSLPPGPHDR
ncbi:hypothetical protein ACIG56_33200 [Nocardia fusca]|uniref:hypothetical protein n=1 Tax=Nocardia fusca TaxID=941183 RepID=UPI0037C80F46